MPTRIGGDPGYPPALPPYFPYTVPDLAVSQTAVTQYQGALAIYYGQLTYTGLTAGNFLKAISATNATFAAITAADIGAGTFGAGTFTFPGTVVTGSILSTAGSNLSLNSVAAQSIDFSPAGTFAWRMNSSGHLLAGADSTFDIGAAGASRPRQLYLGGHLVMRNAFEVHTLLNGGLEKRFVIGSSDGAADNTYFGHIDGSWTAGAALVLMAKDTTFFYTAGNPRWQINASGHLLASSDSAYDIGANGATRPRDLFLGRDLRVGSDIQLNGTQIQFTNGAATTQSILRFVNAGDANGFYIGLENSTGTFFGATAYQAVFYSPTLALKLHALSVSITGPLITVASATGQEGLRLPHGTAPTSPVDGAMWTTTAGAFIRINGVTKTFTLT